MWLPSDVANTKGQAYISNEICCIGVTDWSLDYIIIFILFIKICPNNDILFYKRYYKNNYDPSYLNPLI